MSTITINHLTFAYPGQDDIFTDQSITSIPVGTSV